MLRVTKTGAVRKRFCVWRARGGSYVIADGRRLVNRYDDPGLAERVAGYLNGVEPPADHAGWDRLLADVGAGGGAR